jgi:hypothetical protein
VRLAALIAGILFTLWTFWAMVRAMLVPHGTVNVVARSVQWGVGAMARVPLRLMSSYSMRDRWLAGVAPVSIILQLAVYATILIFTLGLIVLGLTDLTLGDSLYQSGSTFTTLGIVEPVNVPSAITTFIAAFLGLIVIAIVVGYLMGTYSAYVGRESQMARIAMVAGEPAWGPQILIRGRSLGLPADELPDARAWIDWITSLRMNQFVNGALGDFRSTSTWRHWTTTLLAVLDAAALRLALAPKGAHPHLVELVIQAAASLSVLSTNGRGASRIPNWTIESDVLDALDDRFDNPGDPHLTRAEFDDAMHEMGSAGIEIPEDLDAVWRRFAAIRSKYVGYLVGLAIAHHAVRSPWSGSRTPDTPVVWPARAGMKRSA